MALIDTLIEVLINFKNIEIENYIEHNGMIKHSCGLESITNHFGDTLITAFKVFGVSTHVASDWEKHAEKLTKSLTALHRNEGHKIHFAFEQNPERKKEVFDLNRESQRKSCQRMSLDLIDIADSIIDTAESETTYHSLLMVIETNRNSVSAKTYQEEYEKRENIRKNDTSFSKQLYGNKYAMIDNNVLESIESMHVTFIHQYLAIISETINTSPLSAKEAALEFYLMLNSYGKGVENKKISTYDNYEPRYSDRNISKISQMDGLAPLSLGLQYFETKSIFIPKDAQDLVNVGDRYYSMFSLSRPQSMMKKFDDLLRDIPSDLPFRYTMTIITGVKELMETVLPIKKSYMAFFAQSGAYNRRIEQSILGLSQIIEADGAVNQMSCHFATWGRTISEAKDRSEILKSHIQGWGDPGIYKETGDARYALFESIPSLSLKHTCELIPMTLYRIIMMAPITRLSSPIEHGHYSLITAQNTPFQWEFGTSLLTYWVEIVIAESGYGKSVSVASKIIRFILNCNSNEIPMIGFIDVKKSFGLVIDMLKDALPTDKRSEVQSFKVPASIFSINDIENVEDFFCCNPFDTILGSRRPTNKQLSFLKSLMYVLFSGSDGDLDETIKSIIDDAIVKVYDTSMIAEHAEKYSIGVDKEIDEFLSKIGAISITSKNEYQAGKLFLTDGNLDGELELTWWDVVDTLFLAKNYALAARAQKRAVPNFMSFSKILVKNRSFKDKYDSIKTLKTDSYWDYFTRKLETIPKNYPWMSTVSTSDFDEARVLCIDLAEIIPKEAAASGNSELVKQTTLAYMVFTNLVTMKFYGDNSGGTIDAYIESNYYFGERKIKDMYHLHHKKQLSKLQGSINLFGMDEFARATYNSYATEYIHSRQVEGRKDNIYMILISQYVDHFPSKILQAASTISILSKQSKRSIQLLEDAVSFELNDYTKNYLENRIHEPTSSKGSTIFMLAKTAKYPVAQALRFKLSSQELWPLTTNNLEASIFIRLRNVLGSHRLTRNALATMFPYMGIKNHIDQKVRVSRGKMTREDAIDATLQELIEIANRLTIESCASQ
ncbi:MULTISPECIES: hypothetical protein [Cysteiniphilum]|uniref:Type IVa secretion system protein IcmB n=1 Tax=Cysteiniphilum litorale TaxID=2056700 RepID=A0A8J3E8A2_9GAMM|nr:MULTISPECIES: hypothetical protein [Cysteiniphilum]GGF91526.1 type IVa secretion system protein IcmB [Cysteiniphilum litorale]